VWNQAVLTFERKCIIKAYAYKWDSALWNRQEQITNDLEEAQQRVDNCRQRLTEHQANLEKKRLALAEAETHLAKSKGDLKSANDKLNAAEGITRKAETDANGYSSSDARQKAHDARDSENEARHAVSIAESAVNRAECNLSSVQSDLKNAQEEVTRYNAEITAACAQVEEDNVELNHYLFGHSIYAMLDDLDKGIVVGTAIRDSEIREHPSATSRALYSVSLDKEIAVLNSGWDFRPVLLPDGKSLGWIPAKDIRVSARPYEANKQTLPAKTAKQSRQRK
jgi:uncharacterized membrane-anchored protein YhcB (DUF1043 family)